MAKPKITELHALTAKPRPNDWRRDASGRWIMPEKQSEFLDWLLMLPSEREFKTEKDLAAHLGVAQSTLRSWRQNDRFRAEWTKRAARKNISVDRLQMILDMLFSKAIADNDVASATRWLAWIERYMPTERVERDEEAANLSDEELASEMRALLDDGDLDG